MSKEKYFSFKDEKEYRDYLDQAPNKNWLQNRSLGNKNHVYIPIFITEANADLIYSKWNVISETGTEISNGIMFNVKIQALPDYPAAEDIFFTGSAATQFKKKADNHIEFDVPNARNKAIANAFAALGNVFGRSLNRSYTINKGGKEVKQIIDKGMSFRKKPEVKDED